MIYGAKSERYVAPDPDQPTLFELPAEEAIEKPKEEITYTRNKPQEKRQPLRLELPAHLPRREEVIEPGDIPQDAKKIGEAITEVIEYSPASAIGSAIAYTLTLWPRLVRYIEDGRFYIDNNLIENSTRPVALGRKNYMFAGSHEAAQQAAVIYSLLGTCKINNIEPFSYLTKTLSVIPDHLASQLHTLLPGQK